MLSVVFLQKRDSSFLLSSVITSICLFVLSIVLYSARADQISHSVPPRRLVSLPSLKLVNETNVSHGNYTPIPIDELETYSFLEPHSHPSLGLVPPQSVTAVLPILSGSVEKMQDLLEPFLHPLEHIFELVIICPDAIVADVRRMLQKTFASLSSHDHPDVSLRPWQGYTELSIATLRASLDIGSGWILIMDENGLSQLSQPMCDILLNPPNVSIPFGPRGVLRPKGTPSTFFALGQAHPARYLYPPFLVSSSQLAPLSSVAHVALDPWADLGQRISEGRSDNIGGVVIAISKASVSAENLALQIEPPSISDVPPLHDWDPDPDPSPAISSPISASGHFIFLLPTRDDLRAIAPLICRMKARDSGVKIRVLVYAEGHSRPFMHLKWESEFFETYRCGVKYDVPITQSMLSFTANGSIFLSQWLSESLAVDVVLTLWEPDNLVSFTSTDRGRVLFHGATHIRIPRLDLSNTEWMSALSVKEWQSTVQ